jgi:hypothetical protein
MMQFDAAAGPPQHPPGGRRVERQRHRGPRVINGEPVPARLVVHHDEFAGVVGELTGVVP